MAMVHGIDLGAWRVRVATLEGSFRRVNVRDVVEMEAAEGVDAALAAIQAKASHRHAHRHAGAATATTGAIDDVAAAPKAPFQRHGIIARQTRVARIQHQIACFPLWPIAARVWGAVEQAQVVGVVAHVASIAPSFMCGQGWRSTVGEVMRFR